VKGYVQLTPVPEELDRDINVLEQMARASDGLQDQTDLRRSFVDQERNAYRQWSGLSEGSWRAAFLRGYPTLFLCFSGPHAGKNEPELPVESSVNNFVFSLSEDVVYGDLGCVLSGVPFTSRARWEVTAVTQTNDAREILDHRCVSAMSASTRKVSTTVAGVVLVLSAVAVIVGALMVAVLRG